VRLAVGRGDCRAEVVGRKHLCHQLAAAARHDAHPARVGIRVEQRLDGAAHCVVDDRHRGVHDQEARPEVKVREDNRRRGGIEVDQGPAVHGVEHATDGREVGHTSSTAGGPTRLRRAYLRMVQVRKEARERCVDQHRLDRRAGRARVHAAPGAHDGEHRLGALAVGFPEVLQRRTGSHALRVVEKRQNHVVDGVNLVGHWSSLRPLPSIVGNSGSSRAAA
jgi:hypothetical protein